LGTFFSIDFLANFSYFPGLGCRLIWFLLARFGQVPIWNPGDTSGGKMGAILDDRKGK